jgi:predicted ATPase/DNA-binding SARP family transcriptional activator
MVLRTLGGLELKDSSFRRPKTLLLLAYLAVEGAKERQHLSTLLWPDAGAKERQHRLRVMLSQLKKDVAGIIDTDTRRVWVTLETDANDFLSQIESGRYEEAIGQYHGPFLQGVQQPAWSVELEEWVHGTREFLAARARETLLRLGEAHGARGRFAEAAHHAEAAYRVACAPEIEPEDLERCYVLLEAGKHVRAVEVRREAQAFGVSVLLSPREAQARLHRATDVPAPRRHDLPTQMTAFVGRGQELAEIRRLLLDEADCRLLTLVGPGGAGKTRLALAAATEAVEAFPDGVYFVSLVSVAEAASIVLAIAEALHFRFYGLDDPKDQLLEYLSQKRSLLVLDNLEHLLDGMGLLAEISRRAPQVVLLATSRERLHVQEEWVLRVHGLSFPTVDELDTAISSGSETADGYTAVQLFLQRAGQVEAGFAPSTDEMEDIGRICQLVEGMPLGLELAAPWVRTLSCHEIATEIERDLDFLSTSLRDVPERHRSLRVVLEQTWSRLSQAERGVLKVLSIFVGGCTRQAAEAVAGATLPVLSALVDKALVRRTKGGRYELHELIRQFAQTQFRADRDEVEQKRQRHQEYFLEFLEARTAGVKGSDQRATLAEIAADMDNVRAAWRRAVANRDARAIEQAAECLFVFYLYTGGHYEGQGALELAAAAVIGPGMPGTESLPSERVAQDEREKLAGFLLAGQGYFLSRTREAHAGVALLGRALALLRGAEVRDRHLEAFASLWLAWALNYQGLLVEAQERVWECLPIFAEAADHWAEAWSLLLLGNSMMIGRPAAAEELLQRALTAGRACGDQNLQGYVTQNLASVAIALGRYAEAKEYVARATRTFRELDNRLGLGYSASRQGSLAMAEGRYEHAVEAFEQAISYYHEVRTPLNVVASQYALAAAFRLRGSLDQAEQLLQRAMAVAAASDNRLHVAFCLAGLGSVAHDRRGLQQAVRLYREAMAIWRHLELDARLADTLHRLGRVLVASGEGHHVEARQCFCQALDLAIEHRLAPIALDVCASAASLLATPEEEEKAAELVSLVNGHGASTFETRMNARQLVRARKLRPKKVSAAHVPGASVDLWARSQLLLAELAELRA